VNIAFIAAAAGVHVLGGAVPADCEEHADGASLWPERRPLTLQGLTSISHSRCNSAKLLK
jgi:hypothetical protein